MSNFQDGVARWLLVCLGRKIANDPIERNHRFLEESLELVQSLNCTCEEAHQLVDYVYSRPAGEPFQEMGGAPITLAALAQANGLVMQSCGEIELDRVWEKMKQVRMKQVVKPKFGPLAEGT